MYVFHQFCVCVERIESYSSICFSPRLPARVARMHPLPSFLPSFPPPCVFQAEEKALRRAGKRAVAARKHEFEQLQVSKVTATAVLCHPPPVGARAT